jgi:NAD+ kinase
MRAVILVNPTKTIPQDFVPVLSDLLRRNGYLPEVQQTTRSYAPPEAYEEGDIIVALGGDGTVLQAAHRAGNKASILGIHFGRLGFLCAQRYSPKTWQQELPTLLKAPACKRSTLTVTMPDGLVVHALNDVTIERRSGNTVHIQVSFADNAIYYTADGIIFATPTGSTAYNLAAGGPLLSPNASMCVVTPICPHTLTNRSLVLDQQDMMEIRIQLQGQDIGQVIADGITLGEISSACPITLRSLPEQYRKILLPTGHGTLEQVKKAFGWSTEQILTNR